MKRILVAVITLISNTASGTINFFAEAPAFYGKNESSELSKSTPIETYNQLIADSRVSSEKAAKAYKELRAIRSIRNAIGKKYPGTNMLKRRSGNILQGFFGFGAPEDYTDIALDIIENKLAEASKIDVSKDPLENIRTKAAETITPTFGPKENEMLNKIVELESIWGTDVENEKNSIKILELAQAAGLEEKIKEIFPQLVPKREEPVVKEPKELSPSDAPDSQKSVQEPGLSTQEPVEEEKIEEPILEKKKGEGTTQENRRRPQQSRPQQSRPQQTGKRPPSRKFEIPARFKSITDELKRKLRDSADYLIINNIDTIWETPDQDTKNTLIQAAKRLEIWEILKDIPGAPIEEETPQKNPTQQTKTGLDARLAQAAQAAKKTMGGKAPQPTDRARLESSLGKLTDALQKLYTAATPPQ